MGGRIKRYLCGFVLAAMLFCGVEYKVCAEERDALVTTPEAFMDALRQNKSPITVNGEITVDNGTETDGRMRPVMIPAGTQIQGVTGSKICFRSPVQIQGDGVCFKDIGMEFTSSNGLGSVPHREIFLAGHSLILDNVATYRQGGDNPLLGTEEELLPTVYSGGFTGTQNGANASLTVRNSKEKTMFQAIYLGHGGENDNKSAYQGNAVLQVDARATVRGAVDASQNSRAEVFFSGESINNNGKAKEIYGNQNTTVTLAKISIENAVMKNLGNLVLREDVYLSLKEAGLGNVTLNSTACLDLKDIAGETVISGNFAGSEQENQRGILVLNQQGSVAIGGNISGSTQFQTKDRNFPGILTVGKAYITANRGASTENNFVLAQKTIDNGFKLKYTGRSWIGERQQSQDISIGGIEILSAPKRVDLGHIMESEDGSAANESVYFEIVWYNGSGEVLSNDVVEDYYFYDVDYVIPIKTEYWMSDEPDVLGKTDWGQQVFLIPSSINPGRYCLRAGPEAQAGDYTFLFCSEYCENIPTTVADVKALKNTVQKEQRVIFYGGNTDEPGLPEQPETPGNPVTPGGHTHVYHEVSTTPAGCTEKGIKTYRCACGDTYTEYLPVLGHKFVEKKTPATLQNSGGVKRICSVCGFTSDVADFSRINEIALNKTDYIWNGKVKTPSVTVKDSAGNQLMSGRNYTVSYSKGRKNPGVYTVTITFIGNYSGQVTKTFTIRPKGSSIVKLKGKSKGFQALWKKQSSQTNGYELQYCTEKNFKGKTAKTVEIKKNTAVKKDILKLKAKKKYYVRIRTYKTVKVNGKSKNLYSDWSKVKTVRTK